MQKQEQKPHSEASWLGSFIAEQRKEKHISCLAQVEGLSAREDPDKATASHHIQRQLTFGVPKVSAVTKWPFSADTSGGCRATGQSPTEVPALPRAPRAGRHQLLLFLLMQIPTASRSAFLYLISWIFTLTK